MDTFTHPRRAYRAAIIFETTNEIGEVVRQIHHFDPNEELTFEFIPEYEQMNIFEIIYPDRPLRTKLKVDGYTTGGMVWKGPMPEYTPGPQQELGMPLKEIEN